MLNRDDLAMNQDTVDQPVVRINQDTVEHPVVRQPHNDRCLHEQYDQKQGAKVISSALRRCFANNIFVSYQVCPDSGSSGTKTARLQGCFAPVTSRIMP